MVIASIDLQGGRAVQLRQGRDHVLTDERDPIELVQYFNRFGPVALVDLDSALSRGDNFELIKKMCRLAQVRVGGGIRDKEKALALLRAGANKLVIGTAANPQFLSHFPPEKIIVALDNKKGRVVDEGWVNDTGETIEERAKKVADYCSGYLCTFVEREGGLGGMDHGEVKRLKDILPHGLTVAGGLGDTDEAVALMKLGVEVQVGMALYTGKLDLTQTFTLSLDWQKSSGLIPTIVQDIDGQVLMLAYSSKESLLEALNEGRGIYHSRSRKELWVKGETSGNVQWLIKARTDCDKDALLFTVRQEGKACHEGRRSCFSEAEFSLTKLFDIIKDRKENPKSGSYVNSLLDDKILLHKKIIEEAKEIINSPDFENLRWECGDLIFHMAVKAVSQGVELEDIKSELAARHKPELTARRDPELTARRDPELTASQKKDK